MGFLLASFSASASATTPEGKVDWRILEVNLDVTYDLILVWEVKD